MDWVTLSLHKVLDMLVSESATFKQLMEDVLSAQGARYNSYVHGSFESSGDNRLQLRGDNRSLYLASYRLQRASHMCSLCVRCAFECDPVLGWTHTRERVGTRQQEKVHRVVH